MTIPTRWHKPSCTTPLVVVDRAVPECRSCGGTASTLLRRAAEEPAPSYSGIKLPPERPIGQMDLWWPPCVPYSRDGAPRTRPGASSEDAANLAPQALHSSLSEIYTSTLGKDQFRLLYLFGAHTIDSPIHGDLVEYHRENCPEYETTSYTWGGEDGDATPSKPAYFGDFWDALFLTRNCWSLMQYLRPQMGTRVVWVDAICINQNNIQERGAQVSSMPQIYRNCMRVVIYPGDHLVRKEKHKFRPKIRHDDLMMGGDVGFVDESGIDMLGPVLQSRYISRVWIIQELILAPYATLALENHDLYLGNNLLHSFSQKDDRRKWLEFMGQDRKLRQTTLYEGLKRTIDSQATDPRDRIFGILGILGANPAYSEIVPDYSLSMRDCVIGAMGLTLINSKEIWPLLHAHTVDAPSDSPSWVPSLDEIATWRDEEAPSSLADSLGQLRMRRKELILKLLLEWATAIRVGWFPNGALPSHLEVVQLPFPSKTMDPRILLAGSEIPWYQNASIDSSCGALTLQLVRLFDKPHKIVEQTDGMGEIHFLVEGPSAAAYFFSEKLPQKPELPCHIFIAFDGHTRGSDVRPDTDTLYSRASAMCLVLAAEAAVSGTFRLLSCLRLDDAVFLSARIPPQPQWDFLTSKRLDRRSACNMLSLFDTLHHSLDYNTREHHLWRADRVVNVDLGEDAFFGRVSEAMHFDLIIPGQGSAPSGLLQLSLSAARAGEPATITEEFRGAYAACLQSACAEFKPVLDDEYVWFTLVDCDSLSHYWDSLIRHISDLDLDSHVSSRIQSRWMPQWQPWGRLFPSWFDLQIPDIGKDDIDEPPCFSGCYQTRLSESNPPILCRLHHDYEPRGHMKLHYWLPCSTEPRELQMPVRARMPLMKVVESIRATGLNWYHRYLLAFSEKVSEDAETLLERGAQPQDSNIYLHDWPKSLVDDLDFVWRNEPVTFV